MNLEDQRLYRFGGVEVDLLQRSLKRDGQEQRLRPQAFQVLLYLIENRRRLVTKEELFGNVWKVVAVTDDALVQAVRDIRKAVGDDPRKPQWIKTVSKSGYRFIGAVEELLPNESLSEEIEEVTTVEVEMEEEIEAREIEKGAAIVLARTQMDERLVERSSRRPIGFMIAGILSAVVAISSVYFAKGFFSSKNETTVTQVPGRKSVVVMYFDNRSGNPDLEWLRAGLADMLITGLSRSKQVTLLSRQQLYLLLEQIGHQQSEQVRLDETLKIARRSHADVAVMGSFARVGKQMRIDVQLHDVQSGRLVAAEQLVIEEPEQILTEVDFLSMKLVSHLGTSPENGTTKTSLADAMTNNLEAYRYYSIAIDKAQGLHNKDAIELLEKATALDPQFAMAHARIGYVYAVTYALPEEAKPYLEKAFQLMNRLTEKDRLCITAWYAIANRDYVRAIESFREITEKYPLEIEAYVQLGTLLDGEGQSRQAIESFKRGLLVDPQARGLLNALGGTYSAMGRHDEAVAIHRRYIEIAPDEPNAHDSLGLTYQWAGRYEDAMKEYNQAIAMRPDFEVSIVHLGNVYFQMGRYRDAISEFERYVRMAYSDFDRGRGYDVIAHVYWKKGDMKLAQRAVQTEAEFRKNAFGTAMILALEQADEQRAIALRRQFTSSRMHANRGRRETLRFEYYVQGLFALKNGKMTDAINHFKNAIHQKPPVWHVDPMEDCLANAYLKFGKLDEAIVEYERILRLNPNYPLAHYHLAQVYERKGMQDHSREAYQQFLLVWKHADKDLPEIKIARQKLS